MRYPQDHQPMPAGAPPDQQQPVFRLTVASRRENVALVRHVLSGLADGEAVTRARMDRVLLAVSEAATLAVEHAIAGGRLTVTGRLERGSLVVALCDDGRGLEPRPSLDGGPATGMPIMAAIADRVVFREGGPDGPEVVLTFSLD